MNASHPDRGSGPARVRGFTLIELLVSLVIFAFLAVIAYSGLRLVLDARNQNEARLEQLAALQTAFLMLSRDIEQATTRGIRDAYGDAQPALLATGGYLELTRAGWRNPAALPRSHLQRIAYRLDEDRLIRQYWRVLDRAQDSEFSETLLLDQVSLLEIRLLDGDDQWQTSWPIETNAQGDTRGLKDRLPRAIELNLEVAGWGRLTRVFRVPGATTGLSHANSGN